MRLIVQKYKTEIFLFALSFILREYSAQHGQPYTYHVDEHWFFRPAFEMVREHTWNMGWFRVPPLLTLLYTIILKFLYLFIPMDLAMPKETWISMLDILPHQFFVLYIGRLLVAFFGSLTIVFLYRTLKMYLIDWTAVGFSLIFAVMGRNIFFTSYLRPEPLVIFFLVLSTYFLCLFAKRSQQKWIWLSGCAYGLACASKYNASFFLISVIIFLAARRVTIKQMVLDFGQFLCGAAIFFVLAVPYLLLNFELVVNEIVANFYNYKNGSFTETNVLENLVFYGRRLGRYDCFFILEFVFLVFLLLLPLIWKKLEPKIQPLVALSVFFVVSYLIFLAQFDYSAERNVIFVYPFILISLAIMFSSLSMINEKFERISKISMFFFLVTVVIFSANYIRKIKKPLPQDHVRSWIEANAPKGSVIFREMESPLLDPSKYGVLYHFPLAVLTPDTMLRINPKYLILTEASRDLGVHYQNEYSKYFTKWIWSKSPEFEDTNSEGIPLGVLLRVYDFQKYKAEYIREFQNFSTKPKLGM